MTRKQALAQFQSELHVSYSQIFTYLNCSLKFKFQYVENRPMEKVSIALVLGSAIHSAIERRYYHTLKNTGVVEPPEAICEVFEDRLNTDLDTRDIPIIYKKETPNQKSAIETGKNLLKAFYEGIDLTGFEIVTIELPLTERLYTDEKQPTDLILTGIIDLLLKDSKGNLIAVDNKTVKQPYAQEDAVQVKNERVEILPGLKRAIDKGKKPSGSIWQKITDAISGFFSGGFTLKPIATFATVAMVMILGFFRMEINGIISMTIPVSKDYTFWLQKTRSTVSATELIS